MKYFKIVILIYAFSSSAYSQSRSVNPVLHINSSGDESHPSVSFDGKVMVYSYRKDKDSNIYIAAKKNGVWGKGKPLEVLNSPADDETPFISSDGSMILFSSNRAVAGSGAKESISHSDIYISFKVNNKWSKPERLSPFVNTSDNEKSPGLSPDNRILYFSRWPENDMTKSKIYSAVLTDSGFGDVKELPSQINSGQGDYGLFQSAYREGFYFSSKRRGGSGSWDIYFVKTKYGEFEEVINVGPEINSSKDEISVTEDGEERIYFSSNREGGAGGFDIYSYEAPSEFAKIGNTLNKEEKNKKESETGFNFRIVEEKTGKPLSIKMKIILSKEDDTPAEEIYEETDKDGTLTLITEPDVRGIKIVFEKDKWDKPEKEYSVEKGKIRDEIIKLSLKKGMKKLKQAEKSSDNELYFKEFKPIYFDYNSSRLKLDYIPYIYAIVNYLRDNKHIRIRISGHAGIRGNCKVNEKISYRRAKTVRDYILSFGIGRERIQIKGFGNRYPADGKFNELNRRVEFEVID